jgi:DNA-3-methyladenine glycosylase II
MKLAFFNQMTLIPAAPFNFDASLHKPDHFPTGDNAWQPGIRWQTMRWQGKLLGLKFEEQGSVEEPKVGLSIWSGEELEAGFLEGLKAEIEYRNELQVDLSEFYRRFEGHPKLGPVIERWRGMRSLNMNSLYEFLMIAIMLQNATVRRSVSMMQALFEKYGALLEYDGRGLYGFWESETVQQASEEELRGLKVGYRAKAIKRVTEAFVTGKIDELELRKYGRDEQVKALVSLYGVGPQSVLYILGSVYHHQDEMSHISPWEQKIYSKLFFDREPEEPVEAGVIMDYFNEQFGGFRGLAVHYLWEDLWWKRKYEKVEWLEKLIRL